MKQSLLKNNIFFAKDCMSHSNLWLEAIYDSLPLQNWFVPLPLFLWREVIQVSKFTSFTESDTHVRLKDSWNIPDIIIYCHNRDLLHICQPAFQRKESMILFLDYLVIIFALRLCDPYCEKILRGCTSCKTWISPYTLSV